MITLPELYAFIKAFPAMVSLFKTIWSDYKALQIQRIDTEKDQKISELEIHIARLENAKTNQDIATSISDINHGRN